jgi:hypothetical protein
MAAPKVYSSGTPILTSLVGTELVEVDNGGPVMVVAPVSAFLTPSTSKGTFTANGATAVVVTNAAVTANSQIIFTLKTIGGTPAGAPFESAITPGVGFSVKSFAGDTSIYNYIIVG